MRKIYTISSVVVLLTVSMFAQPPQKMSYQAVIRNPNNLLITNHVVGMRISILQGSPTGPTIYAEVQAPTTNANGLVTIEIGSVAPVFGTFAAIDWSSGIYLIKTETDPSGGTNYTISGTSQLLTVPYALYAETSGNVNDLKQQIKVLEDNLIGAGTYKLSDIEGNQYNVVKIGTQLWMKENLKTTKYSNGDFIGTTTPATLNISDETTPKYQWEYDVATYGRYYTWYAVNDIRNLCPSGWHVPSDSEWKTLEMFIGMTQIQADVVGWRGINQGTQLKSTTGWLDGGADIGTNTVGFSALPAGQRTAAGIFGSVGSTAAWWASTEINATTAWYRYLNNYNNTESNGILRLDNQGKIQGLSVRCLRD